MGRHSVPVSIPKRLGEQPAAVDVALESSRNGETRQPCGGRFGCLLVVGAIRNPAIRSSPHRILNAPIPLSRTTSNLPELSWHNLHKVWVIIKREGIAGPFVNTFVKQLNVYDHSKFLAIMSSVIEAATLLDFSNLKNRGGSVHLDVDGSHSMPSSEETHKIKIFGILYFCISY